MQALLPPCCWPLFLCPVMSVRWLIPRPQKIQSIAASRQQLAADSQAAQSALVSANAMLRKSVADKEAAMSSLALAQAEYNVAKGSAADMLATDALVQPKPEQLQRLFKTNLLKMHRQPHQHVRLRLRMLRRSA